MVVRIKNESGVTVRIVDRYMMNPELGVGYDGAIAYSITGGGTKTVRSSVFTKELMKDLMHPQRICVLREGGGGAPELTLTHDQFENNDGRDLLLTMVENGGVAPHLSYEFVLPQIEGGWGGGGWSRFLFKKIRGLLLAARN